MSTLVKISEAASLALHTMALLAGDDERRFTNQEIAERLKSSGHHLAKVMQRLAKIGLVDSVRGPQGGFKLGKPADQTTLLEIFEAVEGPIQKSGCLLGTPVCGGVSCVLGSVMQSVHKQLLDYISQTTLRDLVHKSASIGQIPEDGGGQ